MFDIGFSELALIALLGLLVLGPKRLPEVARTLGRWIGQMRTWVSNVKQDLDREINSEELAEFRKLKTELEETRRLIEQSASQTIAQVSADLESSPTADSPARASIAPPRPKQAKAVPSTTKARKRPKARRPSGDKRRGSRRRTR